MFSVIIQFQRLWFNKMYALCVSEWSMVLCSYKWPAHYRPVFAALGRFCVPKKWNVFPYFCNFISQLNISIFRCIIIIIISCSSSSSQVVRLSL